MPNSAELNYYLKRINGAYFEHFDRPMTGKSARRARRFLMNAFRFAAPHMTGTRKDGSSEFSHCAGVALLAAQAGHRIETIAAGLFHELCEDHDVMVSKIGDKFGESVAESVDMLSDPRLRVDASGEPILDSNRDFQWVWAKDPAYYELPATPAKYFREKNNTKYDRMWAEGKVIHWLLKGYDWEMNLPSLAHLAPDRQHEYTKVIRERMPPIFARLDPIMVEYYAKRWFPGEKIKLPELPMPKEKVLFFLPRPQVIASTLPSAKAKSIKVYSGMVGQPHDNFVVEIPPKYSFEFTQELLAKLKPASIRRARSMLGKPGARSAGNIFRVKLEDESKWRGFMTNLELFHDLYISRTPREHASRVSRSWRY